MKKIHIILIVGVSLTIVEYFIMLLCYLVKSFFLFTNLEWIIKVTFLSATNICILKFIFYFLFWVAAMKVFYNRINIGKSLRLPFINCSLYILISIFYGFVLMPFTIDYFKDSLFYFFVLATFLSPILLSRIPYFKKLIELIQS